MFLNKLLTLCLIGKFHSVLSSGLLGNGNSIVQRLSDTVVNPITQSFRGQGLGQFMDPIKQIGLGHFDLLHNESGSDHGDFGILTSIHNIISGAPGSDDLETVENLHKELSELVIRAPQTVNDALIDILTELSDILDSLAPRDTTTERPFTTDAPTYVGTTVAPESTTTTTTPLPYPIEDAFVRAGDFANENYATYGSLDLKNDLDVNFDREIYLKFKAVRDPATFTKVQLRLLDFSQGEGALNTTWTASYVPDNSWTAATLTFNNRPAPTTVLDTIPAVAVQIPALFDLTSGYSLAYSLGTDLSVNIRADNDQGGNDVRFYDSETGTPSQRPILIFT